MNRIYSSALLVAVSAITIFAQQEHDHGNDSHFIEQLNPAIGIVVDANYYHENSEEGISHIKEEMPGFSHGHQDDEHAHGQENGFNLREVELYLSGEVDGCFTAEATFAFTPEEAELETAVIETTALPWNLRLKGGKFFSNFGIINAQHPHQWDFSDPPLIYELTLGDHGLNEVGVQAVWIMESPLYLSIGGEALQGSNEKAFAYEGEEPLPDHTGPRLGIGWLKIGPDLGHADQLRFGLSGGSGKNQEIHEEAADTYSYLDGTSWFFGADAEYHHHAHGDRGQGDFTLQGEYFFRNNDLDLIASDDPGAPVGEEVHSKQDGYYLQGLYGFLPRLRGGLRWEQVGLTNQGNEPGKATEDFGDSWKATAMVDFSPSAHSLIRLQASNGDYSTYEGIENVWETYVQLVVTLGTHRHTDGAACSGPH